MTSTPTAKVQTNLKLSARRAAALDIAASLEGKDKATIVEEALELRERLMGEEYARLLEAALALRFSSQPEQQLQAIETLREDVPDAVPGRSTSVTAARARLRAGSGHHP